MKPGDKVVCVDISNQKKRTVRFGDELKLDIVYVIRDVEYPGSATGPDDGHIGIRLVGVFSGLWFDDTEAVFRASRFRLVSEVGHPPIQVEQPEPATV